MTSTRPLGAQISHMLKDRGVDVIFGIPGVHNQEMYRGIEEAGITHVLARHEQGAGFMADGYARATGKPGVAYVITGPGLCNIMTPMGQAYSDSVPMLVISSSLDETAATRGQLHQMKDQEGAAATVCDWSLSAQDGPSAYTLIDRAFVEFEARRPRPKHLTVPINALETPSAQSWPPGTGETGVAQAWPDHVLGLAGRLRASRRPLFIFGGGARQIDFAGPVLARWNVASFCTYAARGVVPADDPLYFGSYLARPESASVVQQADLVVVLGSELSETDLWRRDLGAQVPIVRVDIDPEVLVQGCTPILGDAFGVFDDLATAVPEELQTDWRPADVAATRARWRVQLESERPGIVPVCDALRACLPQDTMIYSDMTQFAYAAKEVWDMDRPGHWHHPTGFGTLGYATPAAIGGAVARQGKPTMAIIGDYGFHYTMAELGVAVELKLPIPIILWDNTKLGEIEDSMVRAQIAPNAVVAHNPDFCKLAEAFGANAAAPTTLSEMQEAVRAAFDANGPTLIYLTPDISNPS